MDVRCHQSFPENYAMKRVLAKRFCDTFYQRKWIGELEPPVSELSIKEAYEVQDLITQMRMAKGEELAGFKVGCTSKAIRSQFGLEDPIYGRLFRPYIYKEGVELNLKDYGNCAIEPEMMLKIGAELSEANLSDEQLIEAIEYVSPGIEIHNFMFWFTPPTAQELICSNGIHIGVILGEAKVSPERLSFENEIFSVHTHGRLITQAAASEIMGGPLQSLRWLVNSLSKKGDCLKKGSLVLPGSPVELINITCDTDLKITIEQVGAVNTIFKTNIDS